MSREGEELAEAAASFIGTPFRLHGRDPTTGLDCVGLVIASLRKLGREPCDPRGYRLRNSDPARWLGCAEQSGFELAAQPFEPGDLVLFRPSPGQHHLVVIETPWLAIHAHASLRRVVRQALALPENPTAHWRISQQFQGEARWQRSS